MTDTPTTPARHWFGSVAGDDLDGVERLADLTVVGDRVEIALQGARPPVMTFDLDHLRRLRDLLGEMEAAITGVRVYALPAPPPHVQTVWTGKAGDLIVQWRRVPQNSHHTAESVWESTITYTTGGVPATTTLRLTWDRVIAGYGRALDVSPDAPGLPADI